MPINNLVTLKKHEFDATRHLVKEFEIGVEWQPHKNFELVAMYTISDRTFENSLNSENRQKATCSGYRHK